MQIFDFTFSEWMTIATVLLSVIAIVIAIWSSRQTSKQARKQIESIKYLSHLQIESTMISLEMELFNTTFDEYDAKGELVRIQKKLQDLQQNPNENKSKLDRLEIEFKKLKIDAQHLNNWKFQIIDMQFRLVRAKMTLNQK
jgi:heme/copper-type cytochrome/quinol oxidase subunit 2